MIETAPLDVLWRRVFELAERGRFSTSPNPRVGAVLVDANGTVVGEGAHERAGGPHAEAVALAAAGARAKGATLLVNLEPCSHFGRTPPCTEALLAAGVSRVVCSIEDPDPRTAGRGIRRLRERGVDVLVGALRGRSRDAERGLPEVHSRPPSVRPPEVGRVAGRTDRDAERRLEVDHRRGRARGRPAPARGVRRDPRRRAHDPRGRPSPDPPPRAFLGDHAASPARPRRSSPRPGHGPRLLRGGRRGLARHGGAVRRSAPRAVPRARRAGLLEARGGRRRGPATPSWARSTPSRCAPCSSKAGA